MGFLPSILSGGNSLLVGSIPGPGHAYVFFRLYKLFTVVLSGCAPICSTSEETTRSNILRLRATTIVVMKDIVVRYKISVIFFFHCFLSMIRIHERNVLPPQHCSLPR